MEVFPSPKFHSHELTVAPFDVEASVKIVADPRQVVSATVNAAVGVAVTVKVSSFEATTHSEELMLPVSPVTTRYRYVPAVVGDAMVNDVAVDAVLSSVHVPLMYSCNFCS